MPEDFSGKVVVVTGAQHRGQVTLLRFKTQQSDLTPVLRKSRKIPLKGINGLAAEDWSFTARDRIK